MAKIINLVYYTKSSANCNSRVLLSYVDSMLRMNNLFILMFLWIKHLIGFYYDSRYFSMSLSKISVICSFWKYVFKSQNEKCFYYILLKTTDIKQCFDVANFFLNITGYIMFKVMSFLKISQNPKQILNLLWHIVLKIT